MEKEIKLLYNNFQLPAKSRSFESQVYWMHLSSRKVKANGRINRKCMTKKVTIGGNIRTFPKTAKLPQANFWQLYAVPIVLFKLSQILLNKVIVSLFYVKVRLEKVAIIKNICLLKWLRSDLAQILSNNCVTMFQLEKFVWHFWWHHFLTELRNLVAGIAGHPNCLSPKHLATCVCAKLWQNDVRHRSPSCKACCKMANVT